LKEDDHVEPHSRGEAKCEEACFWDNSIENDVFDGVHHLPSPLLPIFTAIFGAKCGCSNFHLES